MMVTGKNGILDKIEEEQLYCSPNEENTDLKTDPKPITGEKS